MSNSNFLPNLGGAGKSRLPTSLLKYQKSKQEKQTKHIIFIADDEEDNDEQARSNDSQTV